MRSDLFRRWAFLPLLAFSIPSMASASSPVSPKDSAAVECPAWDFEAEASGLLREIQSLSGRLNREADTLASFRRQPRLSWQTHAYQLNQVRERINAIGERLNWLQAIQSGAAPWQQRAIDQIVPVAATTAAHTESAIQHVNEHRQSLFAPVYADHLASLSNRSGELKQTLDTFLEFGDLSDRLDRLQQKLDRVQEKIGSLAS